MAQDKGKRDGGTTAATGPQAVPTPAAAPTTNFILEYRREHPGNRCSYGVAGNPGIVVIDRGLLADPGFKGPITLNVALVPVKADNKQARAEAQALKLAERAQKAQAKIEAAAAKARERQEKADAALKAAQAKVAAATQTAAPSAAHTAKAG